jgi:hypothetical protein
MVSFLLGWALPLQAATLRLLVVGVNAPQDRFWHPLRWAESDAKKVAASLGVGTRFDKVATTLLGAEANLAALRRGLKELQQKAMPEDVVVVYLSAHGSLAVNPYGGLEPVIVLADSQKDVLLQTGLAQNELRDALNKVRAKRKVLIIATCHSGLGKSQIPPAVMAQLKQQKGNWRPLEEASEGFMIFAAAARGETAVEDDQLGGDIYTHFFLKALEVFDRNRDGAVSALEAHDYAKEMTYQYSKGRQRPTLEAANIGDGDFPLRGKAGKPSVPVLEAYDKSWEGLRVTVNERAKGRLPLAFPLKVGENVVVVETAESGRTLTSRYLVNADKGEEIAFASLFQEPPWHVDVAIRSGYWQDDRMKKLTGGDSPSRWRVQGGYRGNYWHVGAFVDAPSAATAEPETGLNTSVKQQRFGLFGGGFYRVRPRVELGIDVLVARNQVNLEVTEQDSGFNFSEATTAYGYGFEGIGRYYLTPRLQIFAGLGHYKEKWAFEKSGSVAADEQALFLGGSLIWGGNSVRDLR